MKIKLCIPASEIDCLIEALIKVQQGCPICVCELKNHIVEEGGYSFKFEVSKGYDHDTKKLYKRGKLDITIDTIPRE